ncbi:MAG: thioredoxin [Patescibacteria group bacterium]
MSVVELNNESFKKEVLDCKTPVLVDFWAPWCGPCKMMIPVLDELAEKLKSKVKIAKLNADEQAHMALVQEYQISSIPNLKLFKNGKVVKDFVGFRPADQFLQELEAVL